MTHDNPTVPDAVIRLMDDCSRAGTLGEVDALIETSDIPDNWRTHIEDMREKLAAKLAATLGSNAS